MCAGKAENGKRQTANGKRQTANGKQYGGKSLPIRQ